jgi:hypothetical protein
MFFTSPLNIVSTLFESGAKDSITESKPKKFGLALTTEQRCTLGNNCTLCNNNWATLGNNSWATLHWATTGQRASLGNNWAKRFTGQLI